MTDLTLPAWTFRPDWSGGILESLEWMTSVNQSNTGAEQRRSLRLSPRRTFQESFVVTMNDRTRLNAALAANGAGNWNVPLPWDINPLMQRAALGDQTVYIEDASTSELREGGLVFFRGDDSFNYDVRQVTAINGNALTLDQPLSQPWSLRTKLLPMQRAQLAQQPQFVRKADRSAVYSAAWQVTETNDFTPTAFAESYQGYPIFRMRPDDTSDLTTQFSRILDVLDTGFSIPKQIDTAGVQLSAQQHAFFLHGRAAHFAFRGLLYALQGRLTPIWLPTYSADMTLAKAIQPGDQTITIKRSGLADFFTTLPDNMRDIILDPRNAQSPAVYRRVTDVSLDLVSGNEIITVDAPFTQNIYYGDLKRISFMTLARLNQDRVEINHQTDTKGISNSNVTFQSTAENRVATDYDINRWSMPNRSADPCICGSECGKWGDASTNGMRPADPSAGFYPVDSEVNLTATYNLYIALGTPPDQAQSQVDQIRTSLAVYDTASRDYILQQMRDANIPGELYDQYALLPDDQLRLAMKSLLSYTLYATLLLLSNIGQAWPGAQETARIIDTCASTDGETLLATFCATIRSQISTVSTGRFDPPDGSPGYNYPYPEPVTGGFRGFATSAELQGGGEAYHTVMPELFPTIANSFMANQILNQIDLTQTLGLNQLGVRDPTAGWYQQPGCGVGIAGMFETKYWGALWISGSSAPGPLDYIFMHWTNRFYAMFISRTPWPSKVKMRQRNRNGQTIRETTMRAFGRKLDGNHGNPNNDPNLYVIVVVANCYVSYRNEQPSGGTKWYADPDTEWHVLKEDGNFVFDILAVPDDAQTIQERTVEEDLSTWTGGSGLGEH